MLARGFNINNLCCNPVAQKNKLVKPPKITILGPKLHKRWVSMENTQNEKIFVGKSDKKADHRPSKTFFISYVKMFWLILCDVFSDKVKRLMQAKTAMKKGSAWSTTPNIKKIYCSKFVIETHDWQGDLL